MQHNQEYIKPQSVKLSGILVKEAEVRARNFNRSMAGQIEFWARIGKIAEENPDISFDVIRQILISKEEMANGEIKPFNFSKRGKNSADKRSKT